jgi:hypothetical protein
MRTLISPFRKTVVIVSLPVATLSALAGCRATDRPYQRIDQGVNLTPAAEIRSVPAVVRARSEGEMLPTTIYVARVEKLDIPMGEPFAVEVVPDDHRDMIRRRFNKVLGVHTPSFRSGGPKDRATFEDLRAAARMEGSKLILVYEHKTTVVVGRELIYRKVFLSRARGAVISTATGEVLFNAEGECEGTIGGLTPLQMSLHPHVEPETKRTAVAKLAETALDTLESVLGSPTAKATPAATGSGAPAAARTAAATLPASKTGARSPAASAAGGR